jgi:putative transcriptional regulator
MTKAGERILRSIRQARAFVRGEETEGFVVHPPEKVDVKAIRKGMGLSQDAFAKRFGFSKGSVQNWEQGYRKPLGAARVLLTIIEREPKAVRRALERKGERMRAKS